MKDSEIKMKVLEAIMGAMDDSMSSRFKKEPKSVAVEKLTVAADPKELGEKHAKEIDDALLNEDEDEEKGDVEIEIGKPEILREEKAEGSKLEDEGDDEEDDLDDLKSPVLERIRAAKAKKAAK